MNTYKKILAAVGYTGEAEYVAKKAGVIKDIFQAELVLMHVIERMQLMGGPESFAYVELFAEEKEARMRAEADMDALQKKLGLDTERRILRAGVVHDEVLSILDAEHVDLVIVGAHSRSYAGALLGSMANSILHHAKTDILAVKIPRNVRAGGQVQSLYKRIVVAIDFMPDIEPVILRAKEVAQMFGAELIFAHVVNRAPVLEMPLSLFEKEIVERVEWQFSQLVQSYALGDVRTEILVGSPSHEMSDFAEREEADLIIMGSHARHGLSLLFGSMANGIFHKSKCDALAVRIGT